VRRLLWLSHREQLFERVSVALDAHAAASDPNIRRALVDELEGSVALEGRAVNHLLTPLGRELRVEERQRRADASRGA
jgi:hypothetical protein